MTERHECEWRLCRKWTGGIVAQCHDVNCKETLGIIEVNKRLNEYETQKTENEAVLDAANSLLGLIDCLGGGFSIDDAGPDRKTLAKLVDYPNHMNKKLARRRERKDE